VLRVWRQHGLKPHRLRGFKVSREPKFVEKLEDIVGLYMSPPEHALVLYVLDGQVIAQCQPRHRHVEWPRFLRQIDRETPCDKALHLIVDNYATHKHPAVQKWPAKHPRFHLHFTPTSASWLNMVERSFRDLTTERLRRGVFTSVPELIAAIDEYIAHHNTDPKPFIWTKSARDILQKVIRANSRLSANQNEALH
jgi:transposase